MGTFVTYEKPFSKRWFNAYGNIVMGTFILSLGYVFFITPHKIVPGGVYGISIVIHHTLGLPVGLTALCFNIPLMILGLKILGPKFGAKTFTGFILTAFFVDLLGHFSEYKPIVEGDDLLASIFGGLLMGIGVGFIFKARATSGGTDVIASIIEKYTKVPLGQLMILVDSAIVLVGLVAFGDWKIPLYSWIVIFIMGKVIDVVLQGLSDHRTLFIISDKTEEIRHKILEDLNRGGTLLSGEGMFNGQPKKIIFTSVTRREMSILHDYIRQIDPKAFVTVMETTEILGKGFKSLEEKSV
ncbi:MAG TPA: YitT family protein [Salinivirgaceae bacterium]|nr:YitT family protein [Salinivirgaceae bacterium]